MKRFATLCLLALALISPAMLVGCGEETKDAAKDAKGAAVDAKDAAKDAKGAAVEAKDAAKDAKDATAKP